MLLDPFHGLSVWPHWVHHDPYCCHLTMEVNVWLVMVAAVAACTLPVSKIQQQHDCSCGMVVTYLSPVCPDGPSTALKHNASFTWCLTKAACVRRYAAIVIVVGAHQLDGLLLCYCLVKAVQQTAPRCIEHEVVRLPLHLSWRTVVMHPARSYTPL